MRAPETIAARRLEWRAERRYLNREKQRIEGRIAELDEILRAFEDMPA